MTKELEIIKKKVKNKRDKHYKTMNDTIMVNDEIAYNTAKLYKTRCDGQLYLIDYIEKGGDTEIIRVELEREKDKYYREMNEATLNNDINMSNNMKESYCKCVGQLQLLDYIENRKEIEIV